MLWLTRRYRFSDAPGAAGSGSAYTLQAYHLEVRDRVRGGNAAFAAWSSIYLRH